MDMRRLISLVEALSVSDGYYLHVTDLRNLASIKHNGLVPNYGHGNYDGFHTSLEGVYVTRGAAIIRHHIAARFIRDGYLLAVVRVHGEALIDEDALPFGAAFRAATEKTGIDLDESDPEEDGYDEVFRAVVTIMAADFKTRLGPPAMTPPDLDEFLFEVCEGWVIEIIFGSTGGAKSDWWVPAKERLMRTFPAISHPEGDDYSMRIPHAVGFKGETRIVALIAVQQGQPEIVFGAIPPQARAMIAAVTGADPSGS